MLGYTAPLRDIRFVIHELLGAPEVYPMLPKYREIGIDLMDQAIEELASFAEDILAPLNALGDASGCTLTEGAVQTPQGFAQAYRLYVEGGWPTLGCEVKDGGQGFPALAHTVAVELLCGANQSWAMYPLLAHGVYKILSQHGSAELQARFLPKIVSGEWTTTMCLTESHSGSDLGLLRTRAEAHPEQSVEAAPAYRLHGSKIFISGGDHDWTDNVLHLVLARLPDAPPGVKGISLFLVPKHLESGTPGATSSNGVVVTAVEHKMGLRGSATCALNLDGAIGWLVGKPHQGLAAMFILMNEARLNVGVQAIAVAQGAYDAALAYSRERLQMRPSTGAIRPDLPADPIVHHADVRRMLLTQKADIEGGRMLSYWLALSSDLEAAHPDEEVRRRASDQLALLTPVAKAFLSDRAFESTNLAMQVFGGHGYLRDHGVEQRVRDVRITQIYEGANGVQARDLVTRKILADGGRKIGSLLDEIAGTLSSTASESALNELRQSMSTLLHEFRELIRDLVAAQADDPRTADAAAYDVLQAFGHLLVGYLFFRAAHITSDRADDPDPFYVSKLATARFYILYQMPRALSHIDGARVSLDALSRLDPERLFI